MNDSYRPTRGSVNTTYATITFRVVASKVT